MSDSTLSSVINDAISSFFGQIYTSFPCVVTVVEGNGIVEIEPLVRVQDSTGENSPIPNISGVPVVFPRSAKAGISWEVSEGDTGIAVVSSVSLDNWLLSRSNNPVDSGDERRNDITDCVFVPGLFPFAKAPTIPADTGLEINSEGTTIRIKKSGDIEIGGEGAQKLVNESFKDVYNGHTHNGSVSPPTLPVETMGDSNLTSVTRGK